MPVPANITREHVFQAIIKIKREGVPPYRGIRSNALLYEGDTYPVKLTLSWANLYINGEEIDNDPANFQADMACEYLRELGFEVLRV